ncbi:DUF6042 family protein [Streptomyces sp. bgisy095]|uniref:DUF6042 family protein n=1 Tax=unclassified Streptomyces TaxID=2593676 RepID=UPI003D7501D2
MTENPSVPGPRRDFAMHNGWWGSGWTHVLPRQAFPLTMLISTASQPDFTGSLDELLEEAFDGHWDMLGGDLDAALTFSWPDDEWDDEEWDGEDAPEGREEFEANHRKKFDAMLTEAGLPVPTTVRELSELYLTWGLAHREETPEGTRWSMPDPLPLPDDLLPLDAELAERLAGIRWTMRTDPLVNRLVKHLADDLGEPQEVLTSLDRLAVATGQDADDVRLALVALVKSDDARVWRGQEPADTEGLEAHRRFRLVMDWERFNENRVHMVVKADDA